jgi:RND family efflux transporter MFP subunit
MNERSERMTLLQLRSRKRPLVRTLSTSVLLVAGALAGCRSKSTADTATPTPIAPIAIASRQPISNKLDVAGEFIPYLEVDLHAKVAGYIRQMNADIGDKVHQGEVLATLDVPELTAQVAGATAAVSQSSEQIARSQSELVDEQANYAALHAESQRLQQASAARPGLIAQQELDNANAKDLAASAQVNAAKSQLSAMRQGMKVSEAGKQQVSAMAAYSRITAPFSGVVTARYADPGALIQAGTSNDGSAPVLRIAEVDKLRLRLPVPASLAAFVKDGDPATIRVSEVGLTLQGTVTRNTDALDPSTRTEQVEIDVPNAQGTLKPGMYATVSMTVHRSGNALTVPITAVDMSTSQPFVMLVDSSNHVVKRNITIGLQTPDHVEVESGIEAGDKVITANLDTYQAGELVDPKQTAFSDHQGAF